MRRELVATLSALVSLGLHAALMAWLDTAHAHVEGASPVAQAPQLAVARRDSAVGARADGHRGQVREGEIPVQFGGPQSAQNVDRTHPGAGGDGRAPEASVLLATDVHDVRLQDAPWNAVGVAQAQRIRTAAERASWDNRRATPNANDQPFLASGPGRHPERRRVSTLEPNVGAPRARPRSVEGGVSMPTAPHYPTPSRAPTPNAAAAVSAPRVTAGAERASPGTGIAHGQGARDSDAAPVATGRPPVDEGPAATLAAERSRPQDNTDSELLATQLMQTWVDASPRSGPQRADGNGGVGGGGSPGSGGGQGEGGRASAHSPGSGGHGALDTRDGRYQSWLITQRRRVHGAMQFPRERRLSMDQGVVVYAFQVDRAGQLVGAPRLARSSGFADFDAAALRAIRATLPTAPPPSALMEGRSAIPIRLHLDFSNPMVR